MFESGYVYHLLDRKEGPDEYIVCYWKYNFSTPRRRYVALVEQYKNNIYTVKYYAAEHTKSRTKYNHLFNDEYPPKIIRTCLDIMLHFYHLNPLASFGFIGSHSTNKKGKAESKSNTQRFKIYKTVMSNFFGKQIFAHSMNKKYSAYLLINKKNGPVRKFKSEAESMFSKIYADLNIDN